MQKRSRRTRAIKPMERGSSRAVPTAFPLRVGAVSLYALKVSSPDPDVEYRLSAERLRSSLLLNLARFNPDQPHPVQTTRYETALSVASAAIHAGRFFRGGVGNGMNGTASSSQPGGPLERSTRSRVATSGKR